MVVYSPIYIKGMSGGLVQERQEFILPNDAYPVLQNAYIFRERIQRKKGVQFVGRLQRNLTIAAFASLNLLTGLEASATLVPGSLNITGGFGSLWTDPLMDGTLSRDGTPGIGTVNYVTGVISGPNLNLSGTFSYYPNLPVMGIRARELNSENNEQTVFFDTVYAYIYNNATTKFQEFIPGFTWSGTDYNFFWSTNYWVTSSPPTDPLGNNSKVFWVTNFTTTDPIRYSAFEQNPTVWIDFAPIISINPIGPVTTRLTQCLAMLPFRGRLLAFRTLEGTNLANSTQYFQRIRWSAIGNPISDISSLFPAGTVNANAWRDDIRGQGGFLDIPTSQAIISVGFVRDNLVVYCESSTWQLRYTGRSIAPFQIERVNAELGTESTFSAIQFDTSLVGIGDKGIVQCDSFKSDRIDIKIPDLVFDIQNVENGNKRVHGIRDFQNKLAYWTYLALFDGNVTDDEDQTINYPNRRLVYNYENDSWAIFQDSFTALGYLQFTTAFTWETATFSWESANFPWIGKPALFPYIAAGNQQGFIFVLDQFTANQKSLYIKNIIGNSPNVTTLNIPNHNLEDNQVIQLVNIPSTDPFFDLNNLIFGVVVVDDNFIEIWKYNSSNGDFSLPQVHAAGTFIGIGDIIIRDGFSIQSKKFNFLEDGQNIQMGYIDILMDNTSDGAVTLNVYADYNTANPLNTKPKNNIEATNLPDTFFNSVIPTNVTVQRGSTKNWQRVYCPTRGSFLTVEYTLSNAQLIGQEQQSDVQIDAQILWVRRAGRQLPIGV